MKRRWNAPVWTGFLIVLAALVSYVFFFVRFPSTRDVPWATLLIFAAGLALMAGGVRRAWREPRVYRGKIAGTILLTLGAGLAALFCYQVFYYMRQLPSSGGAPRVGQKAPDFTLPDQDRNPVTLSRLFEPGAGGAGANGVVLVFYRGYW